ncbi:hypothetical protein O3P69_000351 [Scylla paramamosain]|uniref:Tyrosine-protein kinase n=1 Tax=Scylla paramamosain TaxID=85552 RepID=A0AAW0UYI8_SCYPA
MAFAWLWRKLKGDERPERHHDRRPSNAGPKNPTHGEATHRSGSVSEKHDVLTAQPSCSSNSYAVPSHTPGTRKTSTVSISTLDTPWGTPCENPTEERTVVALNDYKGRTDEDLSFRKGEHLEVLKEASQGWWYARSHVTGLSGYIPVPYVARLKSIEAEPWFFGDIKRGECERRLLAPANDHGSFLIRKAESRKDEYSLSVRDMTKVNHYRIRPKDHGGFFISRKDPFPSLHDLVDYYSQGAHGLCTRLNKPCVRVDTPETQGLSHNTWDVWEIHKDQVELLKKLGSGQFGHVYEGCWNKTVPVAVKTLKPGKMNPHDFLEEAQILKNLRHPKLLQLYAVSTHEEPFYIITELMRNGSLLDYLRDRSRDPLPLMDQVHIGAQVAEGMQYLEWKNYIHRDLAARNVLVGENLTVKVADFGLSRLVQEDEYLAQEGARFPIKWTAPEALRFNKFTTKSDVWSFGVLLMEVVTSGAIPYPTMNNTEVIEALERDYRMPRPAMCPTKLYNMMLLCWARSPSSRPTFEDLHWQLDDFFNLEEADSDYRDIA